MGILNKSLLLLLLLKRLLLDGSQLLVNLAFFTLPSDFRIILLQFFLQAGLTGRNILGKEFAANFFNLFFNVPGSSDLRYQAFLEGSAGTNEEINFLDIRSFWMVGNRNSGSLAVSHRQGEGGHESRNMMPQIMPQLIEVNISIF